MKKLMNMLGVALIGVTLFFTGPAMAQDADNTSANQATAIETDDDDDDSGKWGWLGLLGLLGLYGLKRKDHDTRQTTTTVNR